MSLKINMSLSNNYKSFNSFLSLIIQKNVVNWIFLAMGSAFPRHGSVTDLLIVEMERMK